MINYSLLSGKYTYKKDDVERIIEIEVDGSGNISGTLRDTISGKMTSFDVTGKAKITSDNNDAIQFCFFGFGSATDENWKQPRTRHSCVSITGYANFWRNESTGLQITTAWATDVVDRSEETAAWQDIFCARIN